MRAGADIRLMPLRRRKLLKAIGRVAYAFFHETHRAVKELLLKKEKARAIGARGTGLARRGSANGITAAETDAEQGTVNGAGFVFCTKYRTGKSTAKK